MPVEFVHDASNAKDAYKLQMAYDGTGRRVSKTRYAKDDQFGYWYLDHVTHYTDIGTEVRESYFGGALDNAKVVVNMPQGLGRYMPEDAVDGFNGVSASQRAGYRPPAKFEWFLKNHIGSTMLVYGISAYNDPFNSGYKGGVKAAYDYRAFGEQVDLTEPTEKVTENFTGKEKDDETELNYFGARYLDPMIGMWTSVDAARQFASPYLYVGNGMNPIGAVDPDGNIALFGGLIGVGVGYGLALATSKATGECVQYSLTDAVVDFAFGAVGLTALNQGKKAYNASKAAYQIQKSANAERRIAKSAALRDEAKQSAIKAGIAGGGLLAATLGKKELKEAINSLDMTNKDDAGETVNNQDFNIEPDLVESGNVTVGDIIIE